MHHFIDEAGDLTLFNRKRQVMLGQDGVSDCFMVGAAYVPDPDALDEAVAALRGRLLRDPLLAGIPSMQADARKTALSFHAKDDVAEVRYEVFRLLSAIPIEIFIAIRRKRVLIDEARALFRRGLKLSEHEIYDDLISRLLRNRLHIASCNRIVVARRGTRERKEALTLAIRRAQRNFQLRVREQEFGPCEVTTAHPSASAGLQAIDYFLWPVQRLFERGEDRYFNALPEHYKVIMDLDDKRHRPYGEWYTRENPLTLEKLKLVTG